MTLYLQNAGQDSLIIAILANLLFPSFPPLQGLLHPNLCTVRLLRYSLGE